MTYRNLLVLLEADSIAHAHVHYAIRMAARFECHLTGVAPCGRVELPAMPLVAPAAQLAALLSEQMQQRAAETAHRFRAACRNEGFQDAEALVESADVRQSLLRHAHCNDVTVLGQPDPEVEGHREAIGLVEQAILQSGRPTLVVPYAGRFETVGTDVLVAWDDSREATRAVTDALPLLRRAERVRVLAWDEDGGGEQHLRQRLSALSGWLERHGVAAQVGVEPKTIGIAESMLSRAADFGSDLIVMGAYGHARWAERVLGGATRGLLQSMTVPVLMSH